MRTHQGLLSDLKRALDLFLDSQSPFRIVRTVSTSVSAQHTRTISISDNFPTPPTTPPKRLYILDSSFNPPSRAHVSLAVSALRTPHRKFDTHGVAHASQDFNAVAEQKADDTVVRGQGRLLLLFSTHNATKSPAPAAFEQRLAMMVCAAQDIARTIYASETKQSSSNTADASVVSGLESREQGLSIDVGLTTQAFYTDKSSAIDASGAYLGSRHVHLTGTDTFARILDPKYYTTHDPPLSALDGFFERHALRVMVRDHEGRDLWEKLRDGALEGIGGKRRWAERIEMVEAEEEAVGVSSTRVRSAAETEDWEDVSVCCTPAVAEWVREWVLYQERKVRDEKA